MELLRAQARLPVACPPSSSRPVPSHLPRATPAQAAAYQQLLGLEELPTTGLTAQAAASRLAAAVLASAPPPAPHLSQLLAAECCGCGGGVGARARPPKQRFQDVPTGMRLRYLDWGAGGGGGSARDVVLLLHDLGEAAEAWAPLAVALATRGYRPIALDLRGHGGSSRSSDCRYSAGANLV